jgi:hypothetical protein
MNDYSKQVEDVVGTTNDSTQMARLTPLQVICVRGVHRIDLEGLSNPTQPFTKPTTCPPLCLLLSLEAGFFLQALSLHCVTAFFLQALPLLTPPAHHGGLTHNPPVLLFFEVFLKRMPEDGRRVLKVFPNASPIGEVEERRLLWRQHMPACNRFWTHGMANTILWAEHKMVSTII